MYLSPSVPARISRYPKFPVNCDGYKREIFVCLLTLTNFTDRGRFLACCNGNIIYTVETALASRAPKTERIVAGVYSCEASQLSGLGWDL